MNKYYLKKQALKRFIYYFPVGILVGHIISIIFSFIYGNGYYLPCSPSLINKIGNEINAFTLQTILCGIIGSSFACLSVIFEIGKWSLLKQTVIYFVTNAIITMFIAYNLYWVEHNINSILSYFLIFTIFFVIFWIIQYLIFKNNINKMNKIIKTYR